MLALATMAGCAHTTEISSTPPGATVYLDGESVGETPLTVELDAGLFGSREVRVEQEGRVPVRLRLRQSDPNWTAVVPGLVCAGPTCGISLLALLVGTRFGERYAFKLEPEKAGEHEQAPAERESHTVHY